MKYVHPTGCFLYWDIYTHTTLTGFELYYGCPLIIFITCLPAGFLKVRKYLLVALMIVRANDESQEEDRGKRKFKMCRFDRLIQRLKTSNVKVALTSEIIRTGFTVECDLKLFKNSSSK